MCRARPAVSPHSCALPRPVKPPQFPESSRAQRSAALPSWHPKVRTTPWWLVGRWCLGRTGGRHRLVGCSGYRRTNTPLLTETLGYTMSTTPLLGGVLDPATASVIGLPRAGGRGFVRKPLRRGPGRPPLAQSWLVGPALPALPARQGWLVGALFYALCAPLGPT